MRQLKVKKENNSPLCLEINERIERLQLLKNEESTETELIILQNLKFCLSAQYDNQNIDINALIISTKASVKQFFLNHQNSGNFEDFYNRNVSWVIRQHILELI